MHMTLAEVREALHRQGLRCTRQREVVLLSLARTTDHPTAEELHRLVRAEDPGISLATIYNTLDVLLACGLARRIPNGGGPARFDADTSSHVHVVRTDGVVMDVPEDLSARLLAAVPADALKELESRMGVSVSRLSLQVETAGSRTRAGRDKVTARA